MKIPIVKALKNDPNEKYRPGCIVEYVGLEETDFKDKKGQKLLSTHNLILIRKPRKRK